MRPTRPITFTCEWCYREVTEDRAPGRVPAYCQACKPEVVRSGVRRRVELHRERERAVNPPARGRGRPRK